MNQIFFFKERQIRCMFKRCFLVLACFVSVLLAGTTNKIESTWQNFAIPFPIHTATLFNEMLFVGTDAGVRAVNTSGESVLFTSKDGLEASDIAIVIASKEKLFAVSRTGIIAEYQKQQGRFTVINRSFEEQKINAQSNLAVLQNNVLVIAFKNKLVFFDTKEKSSIITLSAIGESRLENSPITSILATPDSLYLGIGNVLYARAMSWENLKADKLLANPLSWKSQKITLPSSEKNASIKRIEKQESGIQVFSSDKNYTYSAKKFHIHQTSFTSNADTAKVTWIFSQNGNEYFFVGSNYIGFGKEKVKDFSEYAVYKLGASYEITTLPEGNIVAAGLNSQLSYSAAGKFSEPVRTNTAGWSNEIDGPAHLIKALAVLPTGETFYSVWGLGFTVLKHYSSEETITTVTGFSESCMENYQTNFLVIPSAIAAPDGSGFLVTYWGQNGYGLAYVDLFGDVYCLKQAGSQSFSGALTAREIADGNWEIFVASGATGSLNGTGKIEHYILKNPSKSGNSLQVIEKAMIQTPEHGYPTDLTFSPDGALWATTYSTVGFWESGDSLREPHRITQFTPSAISSLAIDPTGNIWVGTIGSGVYQLKRKQKSADTLSAVRYRVRNGLLSDIVYDLALDSISGSIWFVGDLGITQLTRKDLRAADSFMSEASNQKVKVYPNPFRPKIHDKLIFDYVSEKARVSIFNAGGKLVYSTAGESLVGGRLEWNGRDASGNLVAPGVYRYLIQKGDDTKTGRLIIIH